MLHFNLWLLITVGTHQSIVAIGAVLKDDMELCRNTDEDPSCTSLLQMVAKPTMPTTKRAVMPSRTVLMIETNDMAHLLPTVASVLKHTGPEWGLTVVHPQYDNMHQPLKLGSMQSFETLVKSSGRQFATMPYDFQIRNDSQKNEYKDYSDLMKNTAFLKHIPAEYFLVVQHDSVMCSDGVDDFLDYDYVGAPWSHYVFPELPSRVGNGGFSLRSRSFMEWCATHYTKYLDRPEDAFFGNCAHEYGRLPSVTDASRFSMESLYHPYPIAIHKLWWNSLIDLTKRSKDDLEHEMCAYCPAISDSGVKASC